MVSHSIVAVEASLELNLFVAIGSDGSAVGNQQAIGGPSTNSRCSAGSNDFNVNQRPPCHFIKVETAMNESERLIR